MKNLKRIFAILGVILLISLYGASLIFALIGSPRALECLKISIGFTIIIPILLWIYIAMFQYIKQRKEENQNISNNENEK